MNKLIVAVACAFLVLLSIVNIGWAQGFPFNRNVTLSIGDSIILKGVRSACDGTRAPAWAQVKSRLPKSKTGKFSNGGAGTVISDSCGKELPARGVKFKATKSGSESFTIFKDRFRITVQ